MCKRVAVISIIAEPSADIKKMNSILSEFGQYIIGRMGIPYREKNIQIISVVIDAPQDQISTLSGKLGNLSGIATKTAYSNVITE